MTGNCCVQNMLKIYKHKEELRGRIIALLLDIEKHSCYTQKQLGVLKYDILEIFDGLYAEIPEKDKVDRFITDQIHSVSPKTRKKAKELVRKLGLENP
jgi:hypothetical protein